MANTTKATQRSKTAEPVTTEAALVEAVSSGLTPEEVTRAKRQANAAKARKALADKRLYEKRVLIAAEARKAKARKAKLRINAEKARAFRARLAEFEVSKVAKADLVAFVEESGLRKELLHFLDDRENSESEAA